MKRRIITIDEEKCTGCGACVNGCPEGAIRLIDGKARLVGDLFCDGLGACIGTCPEGAIAIETREAEPYDERKVMDAVSKQGVNVIIAHLEHLKTHHQDADLQVAFQYLKENKIPIDWPPEPAGTHHRASGFAGCPGSRMVQVPRNSSRTRSLAPEPDEQSELRNWPIQITLAPVQAPYFRDADLLIAADCVGSSLPGFHRKLVAHRVLLIGCPKLDDAQFYIEKLAQIFQNNPIKSIHVAIMTVPCCGGMRNIVDSALKLSGKSGQIPVSHTVVDLDGTVLSPSNYD
jgi:ferredoxin